jgi:hypothetical protein
MCVVLSVVRHVLSGREIRRLNAVLVGRFSILLRLIRVQALILSVTVFE